MIAVVGSTAVGKSDFAVRLAHELSAAGGGEVVNADSMQVYRGMDIGTAKLTSEEKGGVPHHLLDIWPVSKVATLAEYQRLALATVADISARGRTPILVGGSGMYVHAVVDRWDIPGTDPGIRAALETELEESGPEALHARLADNDPAAALAILPTNGRRIVRALEVVALRGSFSATLPTFAPNPSVRLIGLRASRDELDARIEHRVDHDVGGGIRRRGAGTGARGTPQGANGVPGPWLRPGARLLGGGVHGAGGSRRDGSCHEALRAQTGVVVRPRPTHRVAAGY